jgi:hypothetical protein
VSNENSIIPLRDAIKMRGGSVPKKVKGPSGVAWGGRPTVPIESWLAGLSSASEQNSYLEAYLSCIDEEHVTSERTKMLDLVASAQPNQPLTPPFVVERRVETRVELPVFDFDVPDVPGAEISVQLIKAHAVANKQSFSAGLGAELGKVYSVSIYQTFTAQAGEAKRVYKSVPSVAHRRYKVGSSFQVQPVQLASEDVRIIGDESESSLGSRLLRRRPPMYSHVPFQNNPIDISNLFPGSSSLLVPFDRRHYASTDVFNGGYREEVSRQYTLKAAGTALGLDVSTSLSVTFTGAFDLKLTLPNGHQYELRRLERRPGITWLVDGRPMPLWES